MPCVAWGAELCLEGTLAVDSHALLNGTFGFDSHCTMSLSHPVGLHHTQVFFFRALLVSQDFELSEDTADGHAAWVTASELAEYDRDCADSLGKFIL